MHSKITISPGRSKAAKVSNHPRKPGMRGKCSGWTVGAARRNADFLGSIIPEELTGHGVACSLTVKVCPATAVEWADARTELIHRLRRMGLIRFHWVTEWQMRGAPHLHGIFYFEEPAELMASWVEKHWLDVAVKFGSHPDGQKANPVPRVAGWIEYLAKHGSRSVGNAQRLKGAMPDEWDSAGRLWGKGGEWPTRSQAVIVDDRVFYAYRRLVRNHDKSKAQTRLKKARQYKEAWKEAGALRSITYSRQILKYPKAPRSKEDKEKRPKTKRELSALSSLRPISGFLRDVDALRWFQSLSPDLWQYDDAE